MEEEHMRFGPPLFHRVMRRVNEQDPKPRRKSSGFLKETITKERTAEEVEAKIMAEREEEEEEYHEDEEEEEEVEKPKIPIKISAKAKA